MNRVPLLLVVIVLLAACGTDSRAPAAPVPPTVTPTRSPEQLIGWPVKTTGDPAAWWDSASGDRTPTIRAVEALPEFTRRFSWD